MTVPATAQPTQGTLGPLAVSPPPLPRPLRSLIEPERAMNHWIVPPEITPEVKASIPSAIRDVERLLVPARPEDITAALHRLTAHFWSERGKSEWKIVMVDYTRLLGDLPRDVLMAAIDQYLCTKTFWPKVAELRELALQLAAPRYRALTRLRMLDRAAVATPRQPPTAEQKARVDAALRRAGFGLRMDRPVPGACSTDSAETRQEVVPPTPEPETLPLSPF